MSHRRDSRRWARSNSTAMASGVPEVVVQRRLEALRMGFAPIHRRIAGDTLERRVKPGQGLARIVEVDIGVVERAAVMGAQNEESQHFRVVFLEHLADGEEVTSTRSPARRSSSDLPDNLP
jgi:hypothetical protein